MKEYTKKEHVGQRPQNGNAMSHVQEQQKTSVKEQEKGLDEVGEMAKASSCGPL